MDRTIPETQYAVQLVGPGELKLNRQKPVFMPGAHQFLARVEAVGLCFSDLKLLKQFSSHVRKGPIVEGLSPEVLAEIPGYVPGEQPTVLGHECVCRIIAVGENVRHHKVGERCLVQADYRELRTATSNGAFGYNFEGALQEYILMDERVVIEPSSGQRYLIPARDEKSASAIALAEPWACVEHSYATRERQTIKAGGHLLVVADAGQEVRPFTGLYDPQGGPAEVTAILPDEAQRQGLEHPAAAAGDAASGLADCPDEAFDDIIYFGRRREVIELLNDKLAARGIFCIVLGGGRIGAPVSMGVGRTHYGLTRWVGACGDDPADAYAAIPETGELRDGDRVLIIGAAGPMGQMHVIRAICSGLNGLSIVATDFDDGRLESLERKAAPLAEASGTAVRYVNPQSRPVEGRFTYIAIMAPVPQLVAEAVGQSDRGARINLFAGIPASVRHQIDLDDYIAKRCFLFGTSGSTIQDLKIVLAKVESGRLDTNCSVDAVCGLAGAIDGIAAVENRTLAGKIIVYPALRELGLIPLSKLAEHFPTVAAKLDNGAWTKAAEEELLEVAGQ